MESTTALIALVFGVITIVILLMILDRSDDDGRIYAISTAILIICAYVIGANVSGGNGIVQIIAGCIGLTILAVAFKAKTGEHIIDNRKRK